MNKFLIIFQQLEENNQDSEKIEIIKRMIGRFRCYRMEKEQQEDEFRRDSFRNCIIVESPTLHNGSFASVRTPVRKPGKHFTFFSKKQTYRPEELELIKSSFKQLVTLHHPNENMQEQAKLHLPHFTQFLLDCSIVSHHFMSLMLLPLGKEKWITIEKFILSIESIHKMSFEKASFFYQERDSLFKKNAVIQKMICKKNSVFFKMVESYCGGSLEESDLAFVLSMALKDKKKINDFRALAKKTFDRLEAKSGKRKDLISSEEFLNLLINT